MGITLAEKVDTFVTSCNVDIFCHGRPICAVVGDARTWRDALNPTILLFDIDGTLLTTGSAGRNAVERAFEAYCGVPNATSHISFAGMTDHLIVKAGLDHLGLPSNLETHQALFDLYLGFLKEEIDNAPVYRVLDGVEPLLQAVSGKPPVAVGLGTGNQEAGAMIKLARAGLQSWFSFGGYGSDAVLRADLILAGARKGAAKLQKTLEECRTVIIGDTPKDVSAAHAMGALCLGVATGSYDAQALREAGADKVAQTLSESWIADWLLAG